jgi:hypothetical protein
MLMTGTAMLWTLSCGPSVQSIHEGNVRFEHCYRLDADRQIASSHRQACWSDWVERYTYGQSGDRIEYAKRRISSRRPTLSLEPGDASAAPPPPPNDPAPMPTSIHAPPPAKAVAATPADAGVLDGGTDAGPSPTDSTTAPPGATCAVACRSDWDSCHKPCADKQVDTASRRCQSCDVDYRACMRRCFK